MNDVHEFQWTLMGYMIEGGGSKTMSKAKYWLENYADESKKLLELLTSVIVDYFEMQVVIFASFTLALSLMIYLTGQSRSTNATSI